MITNLLKILVKKLIFLILFLENVPQLLKIAAFSLHQYQSNIEFTKDDIKRIICKFDPSKTHSHDTISVFKLKMYGGVIFLPLFTIFKNYLKCEIFPDDWNKENETLCLYLKKTTNKTPKTIV